MRTSWHPLALSAILAAWLTTVGNLPLWLAIWRLPETQGWHALVTVANLLMLVLALTLLFLSLTMWPRWRKPMGLVLLLVVTSTSYFMYAYGVVIDPSMLRNALYTDTREVRDLLSGGMIVALVLGVLLPGWWWWRQTVKEVPLRRLLPQQLGLGGAALLALPLLTWVNFQDLASLMRNHKPLRYMVNPYNTLYAIGPTALVYVSDHGESLGEKGLYLHGMPYRMAPQEQTHVPMILWVSPSMAQRQGLNVNCLRNIADRPISHDYLFHTMLSLAQVRTTLHLPRLSVLEECYAAGASDTGLTPDRGNPAGRKP